MVTDPFATRFDLLPGATVPYTDDPDGYDPTDALVVYSLPKLDPAGAGHKPWSFI